jgi:hypothetical protein
MRPPHSQHSDLEVIYKTFARPLSAFLFVTFKFCLIEALAHAHIFLQHAFHDRLFARCAHPGSTGQNRLVIPLHVVNTTLAREGSDIDLCLSLGVKSRRNKLQALTARLPRYSIPSKQKSSLEMSTSGHADGNHVHLNMISPQTKWWGENILIVPSSSQHECDRVGKDDELEANLRA